MKVALYARVSSAGQADKDISIPSQLKELRQYAYKLNWEIYREFVDEAKSARTANRPAFQEMISLAKSKIKLFDAILVWKLSRFARNREDSIIYKSYLRKKCGITVISISEQIEDSPAGNLLEGIIEVIDEFYSSNLAQDTIRGMKENASRGYFNGGTAPIGYKIVRIIDGSNEKRKLEPDETFAPIIKNIFEDYSSGMGAKEIVKTLNHKGLKTNRGNRWSKNHIYYILRNEVYIGNVVWNFQSKNSGKSVAKDSSDVVRVQNTHQAIINKETFNRKAY